MGKNECDKAIDKNGTPKTGGTGIKQLRENIAESKLSYEIMDDAAQALLKSKIMDNIHKYFYLILYTAYIRQAGEAARNAVDEASKAEVALSSGKCAIPADQLKVGKTFVQFMEENSSLRTLVEEGKGDLQWERDIPPAALANLEELAKKDFKGNLGTIIHDIITQTLLGSAITTPVIINDQVGLSRATTGCVVACLFKEFQITSSFDGLVETVPGMNLDLLKMDTYKMDMGKDTLFRGEFPVVMRLVEKLGDGAAAKNVCDKVVDKNGTPKTGGTGIKQLRENIAESKLSYEIMDDAAQAFLK